jgi:uncharacterized protein YoxC
MKLKLSNVAMLILLALTGCATVTAPMKATLAEQARTIEALQAENQQLKSQSDALTAQNASLASLTEQQARDLQQLYARQGRAMASLKSASGFSAQIGGSVDLAIESMTKLMAWVADAYAALGGGTAQGGGN